MPQTSGREEENAERRTWMSVLAHADLGALEEYWAGLPRAPEFEHLRRPESGLVMVRARTGGSGIRFNIGEVTVTRCSVRMRNGPTGHAYVIGRNRRHAELAAIFDALLQTEEHRSDLNVNMIGPLARAREANRRERSSKVAATKVDFFTLSEGEDS